MAAMENWQIIMAIFYTAISLIGVASNGLMLMATLKSSKLRSICHWLIFALCVADLLHIAGQIPHAFSIYAQIPFPQEYCLYMQYISLLGAVSSSPICLVLGFDRLIAIASPGRYRILQSYKPEYLTLAASFPVVYTTFVSVIAFSNKSRDDVIECAVPSALGIAMEFFTYSTLIINFLIVIVYSIAYMIVRKTNSHSAIRIVFKSIMITMILVILGWFSTMTVNSVSYVLFEDNTKERMIMQLFAGYFVNISASATAFVYYRNPEYQYAMRKVLHLKSKSVIPATASYAIHSSRKE